MKRMHEEVDELRVQVGGLRGITGLLEGTEQDIREVETRLRATYQGIQRENRKHQNNNLVSLFSLVDKDHDGELSRAEVDRLHEFVLTVYDRDVDFARLDRNADGALTLPEFIKLFNEEGTK